MTSLSRAAMATLAAAAIFVSGAAFADGDAKKGKRVFNKCKACHSLEKGKNKIGPSLCGIVGRKAGEAAKFRYSSAMKKSALTWNEETLDKFLEKPRKIVDKTRMSFAGLRKESDRKNVIAYLKETDCK
jgi:cytochrome c2